MKPAIALAAAGLVLGAAALRAQTIAEIDDEIDLFAIRHLASIQASSFRDDAEYCGLIGYDSGGRLAATPATRGDMDGCEPAIEPAGFEVIASYHTHGAFSPDADTEVPSPDDLLGDFEEGIDGYIATPGGRIWLNLVESEESILLCGPGCVPADPAFRPCPALPPGDHHTLGSLQHREETDPGHC